MENKTWYNITVYLKEEAVAGFLVQSIYSRLLSIYKNYPRLDYFFYINNSRGLGLVLFLEYFQEEEDIIINLYHDLLQATGRVTVSENNYNSNNHNESGIFKNFSPGHVCYRLFKLKTIPFTHFSAGERNAYFSILKIVSVYFLTQTQNDLSYIIENRFLFLFALIYETCSKLISADSQFANQYSFAIDWEIEKVSQAIDKPIRNGLFLSYEKNRDILVKCTAKRSSYNVVSILFSKKDFSDLTDVISVEMLKSDIDLSKKIFIQTLFADICAILNLNNYITCLYFVQCQVNENFQNIKLPINEDVVK